MKTIKLFSVALICALVVSLISCEKEETITVKEEFKAEQKFGSVTTPYDWYWGDDLGRCGSHLEEPKDGASVLEQLAYNACNVQYNHWYGNWGNMSKAIKFYPHYPQSHEQYLPLFMNINLHTVDPCITSEELNEDVQTIKNKVYEVIPEGMRLYDIEVLDKDYILNGGSRNYCHEVILTFKEWESASGTGVLKPDTLKKI